MRVGRLALVVATLVAILVFPLALRDAVQALRLPSAYAAPGITDAEGRLYQNGNNNGNDNDGGGNNDDDDDDDDNRNDNNDESDNEGEDNENYDVCYESMNSNEEVPCDFDDNDNDYYYPPAPAPAPAPAPVSTRDCFSAGQTGDVTLNLDGGSVAVRVVNAGLPSSVWIGVDPVNPGSVPPPPGGATVLDSLVWNIGSGAGCDGGGAAQMPGAVNLGIRYFVSADKSKLQIVRLAGGQWVEVPTVPDPSPTNPYISATIQETGTYAVIQKP